MSSYQSHLFEKGVTGCLMAKADIQDEFHSIPIRRQDYPLLGITWRGQFFHDWVLPMGSSTSCQTFERFRYSGIPAHIV